MRQFILPVILLLALAGCAAEPDPTTVPGPVPPTAAPLPLPTGTGTATPSPLPTRTATLELTPTPLSTASSTLTLTPASTLSPTAAPTETAHAAGSGDPARGQTLIHFYTCDSCHDVTRPAPGGFYAPNLGNISQEAERVIRLPEYKGAAKTPAEYIRESVLTPNVYLVPGDLFLDSPGVSAMVQDFSVQMPPADLEDIIAYLLTLKVE